MTKEIKTKPEFRYYLPTMILFGRGGRDKLGTHPLVQTSKRILLVAGEHAKQEGIVEELFSQFNQKPLVYEPQISKSDFETIDQLIAFCRSEKPDLVIAIGGGTILDTAKGAALLAQNSGMVKDHLVTGKREIQKPGIPVMAIPTTAGTGSEVTPFVVVWDTKNKKKFTLASPFVYPKVALVDSELTDNLPAEITAATGMDALAQAVEAYWSKKHNPISDVFALQAIRLVVSCLEKAVNKPDKKSREVMAMGSLMAGLAFSNTATTICHAVSYPITAYWGIAHGQAVAVTLPKFLEYSLPALKEREASLLKALGVKNRKGAAKKINLLMKKIGLATKLSQLGIKGKDIDLIVKEGFQPERAGNTPRVPTPQELKVILKEIL